MERTTPFEDFSRRDWERVEESGPIQLAMIGVGWWTREEAIPAVEDSDLCETSVLVSGSPEASEPVVERIETIERSISYEAFHRGEAADAYDAIYVVTPNATHLEYVETAAELGKAILCEKPMEATVERAERMVEVCTDRDVPLMVAYRMQTEPAIRRARELVEGGDIGDPVFVHSDMSQDLLDINPDPAQWRLDPALSGGASVMDLGIYSINTTRFVLATDPIDVQASTRSTSEAFRDVPDEHAAFQLSFPDDVLAVCTASQNAYRSSHFRVVGTEGEVVVEPSYFPAQTRGFTISYNGVKIDLDFEQVNQMTEEFDYFADRVLTGERIHPDGKHGLVDMHVLEAVYEAAEGGRRVEITDG